MKPRIGNTDSSDVLSAGALVQGWRITPIQLESSWIAGILGNRSTHRGHCEVDREGGTQNEGVCRHGDETAEIHREPNHGRQAIRMTDERDQWIGEYSDRLNGVLRDRGHELPPDLVHEFVEQMVSTVADTAGINERDARLTIQPAAVNAWANIIVESEAMAGPDWVAVSGVLVANAQYWVATAMPVIQRVDIGDRPDDILDDLVGTLLMVGGLGAAHSVAGDLEVAIPAAIVHSLTDTFEALASWLADPATEAVFADYAAAHGLQLPPHFAVPGGVPVETLAQVLAMFASNLAVDLSGTHRHIEEPEDVFSYEDVE